MLHVLLTRERFVLWQTGRRPQIEAVGESPRREEIEHTGRVLHEIVGDAGVTRGEDVPPPGVQILGMSTGDELSAVSDTQADEMEEHLRGLGYIE